MTPRALRLLALLGLAACTDPVEPAALLNRCSQSFECGEDRCHPELEICVRDEAAVEPYEYRLQIVPKSAAGSVPPQIQRPQRLTGEAQLAPITVRTAVTLVGKVLEPGRPGGLEAELVFRLQSASSDQDRPLSVMTGKQASGDVGFSAALEPSKAYDVRVRPLGDDATRLPPLSLTLTTSDKSELRDLVYAPLASFTGVLQDRSGQLQAERKVLLRHKRTGDIVSSLTRTGMDGSFELKVAPAVLETLSEHELEVGLRERQDDWHVIITVDGSRLRNGSTIAMPVVPSTVLFIGVVEPRGSVPGTNVNASVTFSSRFEVPAGRPLSTNVDWCLPTGRRDQVPPFRCRSTVRVPVGADGRVRAALYPGYYDIYVTPSAAASDQQRVATTAPFDASIPISTQDSGTFEGTRLELLPAQLYPGVVRDKDPQESGGRARSMPSVRVTANALGLHLDNDGLSEIALYNRSAEALSGRRGEFELAVDTGYYDLIGTPPEGSGFPSYCQPNRVVAMSAEKLSLFQVTVRKPVVVSGSLVNEQGSPVSEARVEAFALVRDLKRSAEPRPLRIATATSTDAGTFVLYLPPQIDDETTRITGMDAGVALDASR